MRITRRFVFIHFPKTAGIWTRQAIEQAHIQMFLRKTPLGELMFILGKFLPFLRKTIHALARKLVFFDYRNYRLGKLSTQSYYTPLYSRTKKWFILFAQAMHILDTQYETVLVLRRHTRYAQLPKFFQQIPILSAIRDPFSWHVSRFNYYINKESNDFKSQAHKFIDVLGEGINFEEYCSEKMMKLQNYFYQGYINYMQESKTGEEIPQYHEELINLHRPSNRSSLNQNFESLPAQHYGLMSLRFIQFFFSRPLDILTLSPQAYEDYFSGGLYKDELKNITFLEQSNINLQLYNYMIKMRYDDKDLRRIKDMQPENVSTDKPYKSFYTNKKMVDKIYKLERAIFIMFPPYEEIYKEYSL